MSAHSNSTARRASVLAAALFIAVLGIVTSVPASAGPIGFQAAGGWYTETEEFFLEAGARVGAGSITVIPNIDWLFAESGSMYVLNLDATMSVMPLGVASIYAGAGVGLFTVDPENGDSDSDTVFNLIVGAGLNAIPMRPFGQFKYVVVDGNDPLVFMAGVRF